MPSAGSQIVPLLQQKRTELQTDWVREQMAGSAVRTDLLSENELRQESDRFLTAFTKALEGGVSLDLRAPHYQPMLQTLAELSRSRSRLGFSPSEVATFVFSLKQPLAAKLRELRGADVSGLLEDTSTAFALLDKLGLYTTEIHQQSREEIIRRQQEEMLELSTPVVRLWKGVLALPLIGTLDSARTSIVMETLLQTIVETGSQIAIIDITGVPTVDTLVAQHLLKTVAAARLMGADCYISGIRPQIAQTMVHLQIDLSSVITKATMAEALAVALKKSGYTVLDPVADASKAASLTF